MTLRDLRERKGLSQVALAEAAGLTQQTISRLEVGLHRAQPATINALAGVLTAGDCGQIVDALQAHAKKPTAGGVA